MVCETTATFTHHLELLGRNTTHLPGVFGHNHTHLLGLLGQKLSDQFHLFGHELVIHHEQHEKEQIPGWLPNILNPLVRAAFPKANAYYLSQFKSNVTFDGPGHNRSHPMEPGYQIPTIKPPQKRTVPEYNPPLNTIIVESQQDADLSDAPQNATANASDTSLAVLQSAGPKELATVLQAASGSSLTPGQQLQQVPPPLCCCAGHHHSQ